MLQLDFVRAAVRTVAIVSLQILACLGALLMFIAFAGPASSTESSRRVPFEVSWGRITLMEGEIAVTDTADRYEISGSTRTRGPLNAFSPWRSEISVEGSRGAEGRLAERYVSQSSTRDGPRRTMVEYDDGRPMKAVIEPPHDDEELTPLDQANIAGVSDTLTAFAGALDKVRDSGGADCAHRARIWDGVRLFEVATATLGEGVSPSDRSWSYAGPTLRCRLTFKRMGGFRTESRWRSEESETSRIIHFAEVSGAWLPVRIEISAPLGSVVARTRIEDVVVAHQ